MKLNEPNVVFWAYPAMKKICCALGQKNKFSTLEKPPFGFIKVQLVHWHRQPGDLAGFPMNQMNLVVVIYRLGHKICFVPSGKVCAMNLHASRFIGGSLRRCFMKAVKTIFGGIYEDRPRIFRRQARAGAG